MNGSEIDDYFPSRLDHTALDLVVFRGMGLLLGLTLTGDGGVTGASIYEGANALGRLVGRLTVLDNTVAALVQDGPVLFKNGLFVAPDDANARVTIQWAPVPERMTE